MIFINVEGTRINLVHLAQYKDYKDGGMVMVMSNGDTIRFQSTEVADVDEKIDAAVSEANERL